MDESVRTAYTVVKLPFCFKVDLVVQTVHIFFIFSVCLHACVCKI